MIKLHSLFCFLAFGIANAQPPAMKLSQSGYETITVTIPATPNEKLIELTKSWALERERSSPDRGKGTDITGVSGNTITVSGYKRNAFLYRNLGETFEHRIDYNIKLVFKENSYNLVFAVTQIYTDSDVPVKSGIADYFTSDGTLKEGYTELDTSLNNTVNDMVQSHYNFILNHR
jgi:hypothetical protein